ncbi:MAG TPA: M50 family metallopeptidase [Gemmatales bacterium]|nr:M50 family metallopeptidase [Gemmatales bacterium]HMP58711.1 M50 family metallopeptidase [Gemmatales bacterium]
MTQGRARGLLIGATLLASWLGMQLVHEMGHVLGAWLTGGQVERVVFHPLTISRTDLAHNPNPLVVVWAGPIMGVLIPLALWGLMAALRLRGSFLARFFAGFCLVANGLYIGVGAFGPIGDAGDMLAAGSAPWHLWLFGMATVPLGFWLWHGQGPRFGLGPRPEAIAPGPVWTATALALTLVAVGLLMGGH